MRPKESMKTKTLNNGQERLEQVVTPKGVAVFPHLNRPDDKYAKDNQIGHYKVTLALDPGDDGVPELLSQLDEMYELAREVNTRGRKKPKAADKPIKDELDDDNNPTGRVLLSFKVLAGGIDRNGERWERRPMIVDRFGDRLEENIGAGSVIQVSSNVDTFISDSIGAGITLRLVGVMVHELVSFGEKTAEGMGFEVEERPEEDTEPEDQEVNANFDFGG